jgi:predicted transglutaminase-like cysteine proteinase
MGWRIKHLLRTTGVWVIACAAASAAAQAPAAMAQQLAMRSGVPDVRPVYASVGANTRAPIGWIEFCVEYQSECDNRRSAPRDVVLSSKAWSDMVKVNAWVNASVKPITDQEHWGVVENWNYPDDGYGDCEDYVLLKRRMLMQAGWPREALLITVVRDKKGDGHAVLTVKTNRGEFILDNQESEVLPWDQTGYRFVKRQSQVNPNMWVSLGEPRAAPPTVSSR